MEKVLLHLLKPMMICFVILVCFIKVVILFWWRPKKIEKHFSKQGIRGPPYCLFIGNAKELLSLMLKASSQPMPNFSHNILPRVFSFYHHWKKIYGATFLIWFGPTVRLTVSDPNLIREVFSTKSEYYEKNEAHPLIKQLEGDGLLSLKGVKWAHHRKIISPTFHMENLKLLIPVAAHSVIEMLEKWSKKEDSGEFEVEVTEWYQSLTEDIITRAAFGSSYEEGRAIFRLQAQQLALTSEAFQKVFIPGYRFLPTKKNMKTWKLDKEIKKSLIDVIHRRQQNSYPAQNQNHDQDQNQNQNQNQKLDNGPKDLLGLMIQASIKELNTDKPILSKNNITVLDIAEECKSFFFAGGQTTSNLLTWTTVLLAMHTQWQDLARDEVLRVCGSSGVPSIDDISKLKTLSMILNETLRLYPPIVATIRRAKVDVELGGCNIPSGTELLIPIIAVHHDQAIWGDDVNEFNPNRFANGVASASKHPMALIPFGLGVRTCIGQNLAILQAKITLAFILQRFSFNLSPNYQHAPTVLMLLYPQHGAPIIFRHLADPQPN